MVMIVRAPPRRSSAALAPARGIPYRRQALELRST